MGFWKGVYQYKESINRRMCLSGSLFTDNQFTKDKIRPDVNLVRNVWIVR